MKPQMEQVNVIVIGGGTAGLTAACYLARAGVAVTVYEKASKLGGRATTQEYAGYKLNRGIHALYTGGAASNVLHELGVSYTGGSPKGIYALRQGKLYVAPVNMGTMLVHSC